MKRQKSFAKHIVDRHRLQKNTHINLFPINKPNMNSYDLPNTLNMQSIYNKKELLWCQHDYMCDPNDSQGIGLVRIIGKHPRDCPAKNYKLQTIHKSNTWYPKANRPAKSTAPQTHDKRNQRWKIKEADNY